MADAPGRESALILAPIGRDATLARDVLQHAGIEATICVGLDALVAALAIGAGTAILTEEALTQEDPAVLVRWLDAQPAWSDFPFVALTSNGAVRRGLDGMALLGLLRNVTLLERPVKAVTLASAVQAALRARRRQYEVQAHLLERELNEAELRCLNETLEQRVADRTIKLAEANQRLRTEIEERRRAEEALRHAQKMQAVGQLTGGIAHDFNNMLTAIMGNLDLLQQRLGDDEKLQRPVAMAARGVERASRMTQQLLAFSRKQHLEPRPIDFNAVVDGIEDLLVRTCGEALTVTKTLARDLWPALTDPHQLESALLNLVINARDATPPGGTITIATHNVAVDAAASAASGFAAGDYVELAVTDTGHGMSPEIAARVFEPFFTTKEVGKGSGLGLSMVYGFVRQSNGHVRIDSAEGAGTTVHLFLPRAAAARAVGEPRPVGPAVEPTGTAEAAKILVVEDASDVREIAVAVLKDFGFTVLEAGDASSALDILIRNPDVSLVFTDVVMPGDMNGMDLARTVAERWPGLRLILTSGYAERLNEREWLPPDVGFLRKPYRPVELIGKIKSAVRGDGRGPRMH